MKLKLLLASVLALALAPALHASDRADAIHARCVEVMQMGTCAALRPVSDYTEAELNASTHLLGLGVITWRDFLAVRGLGSIDRNDTRMCGVAAEACRADWNGPRCLVGRHLWGN